jgi:biotin carboxyl carrier protein
MKLSVRVEGRTFEVEVADLSARPIVASVDGERFEIWPEEAVAASLPAPGAQVDGEPSVKARGEAQREIGAAVVPTARPSWRSGGTAEPPSARAIRTVHAPLPGVIDSIAVQVGDEVNAGQELCVLEAMKMKNIIRSSRSGEVARLYVSIGQHVKHNDALIEFVA